MNRKWIVVSGAGVVFIISIFLMTKLGTEFLPELDEGSILIEQVRMPSVTLDESIENANWLAGKLVQNIPEIQTVVPKTGRSDLANDWMGVHQTDVWVILKPQDEWRKGITKEDIIDQIEPYLETEPGLVYNFTQPIAMRVDELTSGVKSDLAVKIYGEELDELSAIGGRISDLLPKLEGTANFYVEQTVGQPYITIEIDREAVASFGLNVDNVQKVIEAGIGGQEAGQLYEGQRRFGIVVRYPEDIRDELYKIQDVPVHLPNGEFVPLKRVAKIILQEGPREIQRENGWRRLIVGINIRNIDLGTYVANLQQEIQMKANIPPGYFIGYGGTFENQQRAMRHLLLVVPLSIFIIIGLLYLNFGKMKYAILILLNLPFALSGGVFLLWMRGMYLSISASIGFVALFGVAVLNGIVLVDHINELRKENKGKLKDIIIQGSSDRLRPVMMTALVASLGFIPMAFNTGPGSEVQRPLATVVIGGLITSTFLTLMVLPIIYHWMDKRSEKETEEEEVSE
jgi:cobalt-zinc-cadmium resistance protein CzcA